jgi:hypothetical protein
MPTSFAVIFFRRKKEKEVKETKKSKEAVLQKKIKMSNGRKEELK